ncbi:MAG TPA: hypothetical protein VFS39_02055 [Nitrospira sp.]|nr:hypothetical protein [Nitrospira sp.]
MMLLNVSSIVGGTLIAILLSGCAGDLSQVQPTTCGSDYNCLATKALQYRQQAMQMGAMAERYELEADVHAKRLGAEAEEVKHSRELAQQYRSGATEADDLARQYRSQLPHNLVY